MNISYTTQLVISKEEKVNFYMLAGCWRTPQKLIVVLDGDFVWIVFAAHGNRNQYILIFVPAYTMHRRTLNPGNH